MSGDWRQLESLAQSWHVTHSQLAEIFHVPEERFEEMCEHPMSGEAHGVLMELQDIDRLIESNHILAVRTPRPELAGQSILQALAKRSIDPHILQAIQTS